MQRRLDLERDWGECGIMSCQSLASSGTVSILKVRSVREKSDYRGYSTVPLVHQGR